MNVISVYSHFIARVWGGYCAPNSCLTSKGEVSIAMVLLIIPQPTNRLYSPFYHRFDSVFKRFGLTLNV